MQSRFHRKGEYYGIDQERNCKSARSATYLDCCLKRLSKISGFMWGLVDLYFPTADSSELVHQVLATCRVSLAFNSRNLPDCRLDTSRLTNGSTTPAVLA